jgi:hemerythrin-like domain-containing protein
MKPTEILMEEHKIILKVVYAAESEANDIAAGKKVDAVKIEKMVDFIRNFADKCHHTKEEKILFVRMVEKGMPKESGPIAVMLREHEEGRARVKNIVGALNKAVEGDTLAISAVSENLAGYAVLLKAHIAKEDTILFPMADRLFTPEDQKELSEAFEKVEREEIGAGVHEKYHVFAHELETN